MNDHSQIIGFRITAALAPVLVLGAFQFFLNEPTSANASNAFVADTFLLPEIPSDLSLDQETSRGFDAVSSPFWFVESGLPAPELPTINLPIKPPIANDPVFTLSAVLPSPTKSFAVVNGKARSQGDEIEPGWTLVLIDGDGRSIILQHTSGRKLRVSMKQN